jgi:predicted ferric reductase
METSLRPVVATPRPLATTVHRRRTVAWNAAAVALVWLTGLSVLVIWVHGGAVGDLGRGVATAVSAIGALVGLLAAWLLLLQVALMSRLPVFERGFGRDNIVRAHRTAGFWSFWLILAHVALLAVGFGLSLEQNPFAQLVTFWTDFPGVSLAVVGTVAILLAVVLMSVRRIRRRTRYEVWHLWHLVAYVGAAVVVPHMLWSGASFLASGAATAYWWVLWGATFACVVVFRVVRPLVRFFRHDIRLVSAQMDGSRGLAVRMEGKDLDRLGARGGQFFVWRFVHRPGLTRGNPFSLSLPPTDTQYAVCVRLVGDGTRRILDLPPGTRVLAEGPYGRVTGDLRKGHRLLMFAAGAGVGPMVSILGEQEWEPGEAVLVTRDNVPEETMMIPEITALVEQRGLIWERLVGGFPSSGSRWLPPDEDGNGVDGVVVIRRWVGSSDDGAHDTDVFLCGPPPWMDAVMVDLDHAGVPRTHIHTEEFAF